MHGLRDTIFEEAHTHLGAQNKVESDLAALIGCETKDVLVCACGMNAFYAGFRAVQEAQLAKGRTQWLQMGWLYLDSGCVLKEFLSESESLECCDDAVLVISQFWVGFTHFSYESVHDFMEE